MTSATAGVMVFDEEPTVNTLEEMHTGTIGMEAAAYCPRGSGVKETEIQKLTFRSRL